ncbi:MAG: hypothetical protein COU69_04310 [Candidatus Pacebacteria bacterium CG10_big_fil_rev_8_21_14_0_10_56_10]|nr:MAG: hypothetical protein COU69_04310 [Candidatus Pacebacteria bacterium CG10_big_fil_rev_8_21_14_0_10_56_10]
MPQSPPAPTQQLATSQPTGQSISQPASTPNSQSQQPPAGQVIAQTDARFDQHDKTRTLYDVTAGEIFWKNFLAGLGRGLGGVLILILFWGALMLVAFRFLLPALQPLFDTLDTATQSLDSLNQLDSGGFGPGPTGSLDRQQVQEAVEVLRQQ